jgi:predicted AlkP superfamily phosphohydrolase/phosphomutase
VGHIYDRFSSLSAPEAGSHDFYMLSDHGFTAVETEVYLNRWLKEQGYLKFSKDQVETIMDIGKGSAAFAMDPSRIYINLKGKYPLGTVETQDYEKVREELRTGLEGLYFDNGKKVVKQVYAKEELYQGPFVEQAPDLVVLSNHGFDLKGKATAEAVFGRSNLVGMHTQDDAFFFSGNNIACRSIFDAKRIIQEGLSGHASP